MLCAWISIAMQLTCAVDNDITCTDNGYLAQLLNVPSCERVLSRRDRGDILRSEPMIGD
jgi:hypothetical protein